MFESIPIFLYITQQKLVPMSAFAHKFSPFIQKSLMVTSGNYNLFSETKIAPVSTAPVWRGICDNFPFDGASDALVLQFPNKFRKSGFSPILLIIERFCVVIKSWFERASRESKMHIFL